MLLESKEILSHTADIKIRLKAETMSGLFLLGLKSLNQLLLANFDKREFTTSISEDIELESPDTTTLFIDFLSEVLTLSQINKAVFFDFKMKKFTGNEISGTLSGAPVEAFSEDVKAVTHHEADVKVNEQGNWETIIIFDI